jgi:2-keto-4-pentenoate hydratase
VSVLENIAKKFVQARLSAGSLTEYPGPAPQTISEAYSIQDAAIDLWPDEVAGWKVGRINGADVDRYGTDRLAGPIFSAQVRTQTEDVMESPVYADGFAAVEGECVIMVAADADPAKTEYTTDEAIALIKSIHAGVEIASSPFSGINDHGPLVTISDFGNNHGLIIGGELPNWQSLKFGAWPFETIVDGKCVGEADASGIPGGPVESFRFMLENAAQRGMPLKQGMAISTGAVTGVHPARVGQNATVLTRGVRDIALRLTSVAELAGASV